MGVMLVLVMTSAFVAGTTATFSAGTGNSNTFQTSTLVSPGDSTSVSIRGHDVLLSWLAIDAQDRQDTGYRISKSDTNQDTFDDGGSPGCTNAVWDAASRVDYRDPDVASYTHESTHPLSFANDPPGRWFCYRIETIAPCCDPRPDEVGGSGERVWTVSGDDKPTYQLQAGMVVRSVTIVGNNSNSINTGDKILIEYNQPVDVSVTGGLPGYTTAGAAEAQYMCSQNSTPDRLWIGATTCGPATSANVSVGHIEWSLETFANPNRQWPLTFGWSSSAVATPDTTFPYDCGSSCTVLTATLGSGGTKPEPGNPEFFRPSTRSPNPIRSYWDADGDNSTITNRIPLCTDDSVTDSSCLRLYSGHSSW